jgi:hypothetical protein
MIFYSLQNALYRSYVFVLTWLFVLARRTLTHFHYAEIRTPTVVTGCISLIQLPNQRRLNPASSAPT